MITVSDYQVLVYPQLEDQVTSKFDSTRKLTTRLGSRLGSRAAGDSLPRAGPIRRRTRGNLDLQTIKIEAATTVITGRCRRLVSPNAGPVRSHDSRLTSSPGPGPGRLTRRIVHSSGNLCIAKLRPNSSQGYECRPQHFLDSLLS
jgi:hypothetical protein